MPDRRGSRFILEVLFLLGLAVALTLAQLSPLEIAGVMLVGWVIVAALEWAAWRSEPHYGSGLPPRYYVPQVSLPPAQPLEQVSGYPEAQRDEAPTWIASAALRAEVLGEWPAPPPADTQEAEPVVVLPEPIAETQPDPWTAVELPVAPLGEPEPEPEPELELEREPEPEPVPSEEPEHEASLEVALVRSVQGVAQYHLDPLGDPPPRRRFGRNGADATPTVEVPARPEGIRALPGRSNSQD
ncbi:MAG TPA: hypothetical protein VF379_03245 [Gaiellaceae bacterium]